MTNGQPGRSLPPETIETVKELLTQGLSVAVVAKRTGVSRSHVSQRKDANQPTAEQLAESIWPDEEPEIGRSQDSTDHGALAGAILVARF